MQSTCTLLSTVGLHVTVPRMPVSQLNGSLICHGKKVCLWYLRKNIVCFWSGREKMLCFLIMWLGRKTKPSPLVLNGPPLMHSRAYFALIRHFLLYWGHWTEGMGGRLSKQETLSQCYINVDPRSLSLVQHKGNIGSTCCVCWGFRNQN